MDSTSLGQIPVVYFSEHGTEPSYSTKCRECIDQPTDYHLCKDYAPWRVLYYIRSNFLMSSVITVGMKIEKYMSSSCPRTFWTEHEMLDVAPFLFILTNLLSSFLFLFRILAIPLSLPVPHCHRHEHHHSCRNTCRPATCTTQFPQMWRLLTSY